MQRESLLQSGLTLRAGGRIYAENYPTLLPEARMLCRDVNSLGVESEGLESVWLMSGPGCRIMECQIAWKPLVWVSNLIRRLVLRRRCRRCLAGCKQ